MMLQRLQAGLGAQGLRALLVVADSAADPDLAPFSGPVHLRRSLLLVPTSGVARLAYFTPMERQEAAATGLPLVTPEQLDLARWEREYPDDSGRRLAGALGQAFLHCGVAPGKIALAGHGAAGDIHAACRELEGDGYHFVPGHDLVRTARKRKTADQLAEIRRAAQGTCAAFWRVAELLAGARHQRGKPNGALDLGGAPLTVARLRGEIAVVLAQHGLEQPDGNIVAPAEEGAVPHNAGRGERRLRAGESLVVDLFPRGRLFADCTRTFCVGSPPEVLLSAHGAVLDALRQAHTSARPGAWGADLQKATSDLFEKRGYASGRDVTCGYVHGLGHGVGFELHEAPSFRSGANSEEGQLELGDVFTLEPGLYDPVEGFGVRLEDLVTLQGEGLENLTPLPYELDPRVWTL